MDKVKKNLKVIRYFGTFVIVFIISFVAIIMLWPESSDESTSTNNSSIKKAVITSREQAREEMEKFLLEKYGVEYNVSLPARTDIGDFHAYFFNPIQNYVEINVETGECKDSGINFIVKDYLEEKIEPIINSNWNENIQEDSVYFFDDVPSIDWPVDSNPLDIIDKERMRFELVVVVNTESIDKSVEAAKVKQLIDLEELYNFDITFHFFYANNEEYKQIEQTFKNNTTHTDIELLMSIGDNYYNKLVIIHTPSKREITTDEIINFFTN